MATGIINQELLNLIEQNNQDAYGAACVAVAKNIMTYLDANPIENFNIGYSPDMTTPHGIICHCDNQGGITGYMSSAARNIVAQCYRDGWKFWLADVISKYDIEDGVYPVTLANEKYQILTKGAITPDRETFDAYLKGLIERFLLKQAQESQQSVDME